MLRTLPGPAPSIAEASASYVCAPCPPRTAPTPSLSIPTSRLAHLDPRMVYLSIITDSMAINITPRSRSRFFFTHLRTSETSGQSMPPQRPSPRDSALIPRQFLSISESAQMISKHMSWSTWDHARLSRRYLRRPADPTLRLLPLVLRNLGSTHTVRISDGSGFPTFPVRLGGRSHPPCRRHVWAFSRQ